MLDDGRSWFEGVACLMPFNSPLCTLMADHAMLIAKICCEIGIGTQHSVTVSRAPNWSRKVKAFSQASATAMVTVSTQQMGRTLFAVLQGAAYFLESCANERQ